MTGGPIHGPRALVTTSWDDGGREDIRIADALATRGLLGTFYWPVAATDPRYGRPDAAAAAMLLDQGMEIGSHTMTHPILTSVDKPTLNRELAESKARLEDLTGNGVTSFCYPAGFHNAEVRAAVRRVGYSLGRTTMGFRTESTFDPFAMPVTAQMYPHGRRVHVTHSIRKRNIGGLAAWFGTYRASSDLETIAAAALQKVEQSGGVVHLWGHGWEIESLGIWPRLEILLDMLAEFVQSGAARSATNGEVVEALR